MLAENSGFRTVFLFIFLLLRTGIIREQVHLQVRTCCASNGISHLHSERFITAPGGVNGLSSDAILTLIIMAFLSGN